MTHSSDVYKPLCCTINSHYWNLEHFWKVRIEQLESGTSKLDASKVSCLSTHTLPFVFPSPVNPFSSHLSHTVSLRSEKYEALPTPTPTSSHSHPHPQGDCVFGPGYQGGNKMDAAGLGRLAELLKPAEEQGDSSEDVSDIVIDCLSWNNHNVQRAASLLYPGTRQTVKICVYTG